MPPDGLFPNWLRTKPLARTTDPATSKAAARGVRKKLPNLVAWAAGCVARHPGMTSLEITKLEGEADPRKLNRRLGEAERAGLVCRGPVRKCGVSGKRAETWFPKG